MPCSSLPLQSLPWLSCPLPSVSLASVPLTFAAKPISTGTTLLRNVRLGRDRVKWGSLYTIQFKHSWFSGATKYPTRSWPSNLFAEHRKSGSVREAHCGFPQRAIPSTARHVHLLVKIKQTSHDCKLVHIGLRLPDRDWADAGASGDLIKNGHFRVAARFMFIFVLRRDSIFKGVGDPGKAPCISEFNWLSMIQYALRIRYYVASYTWQVVGGWRVVGAGCQMVGGAVVSGGMW